MIQFQAFSPFIKQLRSDKGWRVEFDVPQIEYDNIKDLPKLDDEILIISVKQSGENKETLDLDE